MAVNVKTLTDDEFFYGHKACAGCGGSLAVRIALKVWFFPKNGGIHFYHNVQAFNVDSRSTLKA